MSKLDLQNVKSRNHEMFATFMIQNYEFAISIQNIEEVILFPDTFEKVPQVENYNLGIFQYKNQSISVVSMEILLQLDQNSEKNELSSRKIAIINNNQQRIGILVDQVGEVLKNHEIKIRPLEYKNDDTQQKHQVVQNLIYRNNSEKALQLIDLKALFLVKGLFFELNDIFQLRRDQKKSQLFKCITFKLGEVTFAIEMKELFEIGENQELIETDLSYFHCIGKLIIRDQHIPILDLKKIFKIQESKVAVDPKEQKIIFVTLDQHYVGFLVDQVLDIVQFYEDEIQKTILNMSEKVQMFHGVIHKDNRQIVFVNKSYILSSQELNQISDGHKKIYHSSNSILTNQIQKKKKMHIGFEIRSHFVLEFSQIREIIEDKFEIQSLPGAQKGFLGTIQYRNQPITIIDVRQLCKIEAAKGPVESRILILRTEGPLIGLKVDRVTTILHLDPENTLKMPEIYYNLEYGNLKEFVHEIISIDDSLQNNSVLKLDLSSIAKKLDFKLAV